MTIPSHTLCSAMDPDDLAVAITAIRDAGLRELPTARLEGLPLSDGAIEASFRRAIEEILSISVIDIMTSAWRKWMEIRKYADADARASNSKFIVPLAEHKVTSAHHPKIVFLVNETEACSLVFDLLLDLTAKGFQVTVHKGRIISVETGRTAVGALLSYHDKEIWSTQCADMILPGRIDFDEGLPIDLISEAAPDTGAGVMGTEEQSDQIGI